MVIGEAAVTPQASIIISSHDRLSLLRRTLYAIANRSPSVPYEVILVDDGSSEPVLDLLSQFGSAFQYSFVRVDMDMYQRTTGLSRYLNNPAHCLNVGIKHTRSNLIFLQGNEVIPWKDCYDKLLATRPDTEFSVSFSTTFDVPRQVLDTLDSYGSNLSETHVRYCSRWHLASPLYHSDVMAYVSLTTRALWDRVRGFNEFYLAGIGAEDNDAVRRFRAIPGWSDARNMVRSDAVSLHQDHGGRTRFKMQDQSTATNEQWVEGERRKKAIWDSWDGEPETKLPWAWGEVGVVDVIRNW